MNISLALLLTICSLLGVLTGCEKNSGVPESSGSVKIVADTITFGDGKIPEGIVAEQVRGESDSVINLSGRLRWDEENTVRIYSSYSGRVVKILAKLGAHVTVGAPLAQISSSDFGSAQADYKKALAAQKLARNSLDRANDLFNHGVIARKDLEQADADSTTADAESERAGRLLQSFGDPGDGINQFMFLKSPIEGVVVDRNINPGQQLTTDQSVPPQFIVTNPKRLLVQLDAHEDDLNSLHAGNEFSFSVSAYPRVVFTGLVTKVADYVDPVTRAIKVLGNVENEDQKLKGDMFIEARIKRLQDMHLVVPASAVLLIGDKNYIFIRNNNNFERREVVINTQHTGSVDVSKGIENGEMVVTQGAIYLQALLSKDHG